jgi:hypothetical protein
MLNLRCDDVVAFVAELKERALKREVVGFATAARKDDLIVVAPSRAATWSRAGSSAALASVEAQCPLDGLPKCSSRNGRIAATTAGSIGVLAL